MSTVPTRDNLRSEVSDALVSTGYARLKSPLQIGDITLDLESVYIGPDDRLDLVAIVDQPESREDGLRVHWQIQRLARALDAAGSRRSISIILLGAPSSHQLVADLQTLARVLPVDGSLPVRRLVAPLLNLSLPDATQSPLDGGAQVRETIRGHYATALLEISAAAQLGKDAVEAQYAAWIDQSFARPHPKGNPHA